MPLVNAKCTNCGANLKVDSTKDAAICEYCGSAFIVEKAINNYNIINHIHADVVNIYNGNSADFEIRTGVLIKYNGAKDADEVRIPNGVIKIGMEAFRDCREIKSVIISDSVTCIGKRAFDSCWNLSDIIIPENVKSIEDAAFSSCYSLKSIQIPNSVTNIGGWAFSSCRSLKSFKIPNSVTRIGEKVFSQCWNLENVIIPDSVNDIGKGAFSGCNNLQKVVHPNHLRITDDVFGETPFYYVIQKERRKMNVCQYCGGEFKGVIRRVCIECGRNKNY